MRPSRRAAAAGAVVAVTVSLSVTGCGVPQDRTTHAIEPSRVPYDLLGPDRGSTASPTAPEPDSVEPNVFFLDADDRLVPRPQVPSAMGAGPVVTELLATLTAGPTDQEHAAGLSSALGPGVRLTLLDIRERVARLSVVRSEQRPRADRIPLAVGQVVFSVTSVDGIDRVQLVRRGRIIEVPLPGGARTSDPVGASDYLSLLTGPPR